MKRTWTIPILVLMIMGGLSAGAREATLSSNPMIEETVLPNGVKILTKVNPSSEIVALRVYLSVGPRYETEKESGLSNLMLRLLQAGTQNRTAKQIANDVDSIGAEFSSDVNKDYGALVLKTTRATFQQGLDILFDCLLHPTFPVDRFENERDTILKEIRQEKDSLLSETFRLFQKEIYQDHPYGQPAIGLEETVSEFEREDVVRFYEEHLNPSEILVVGVGNFDPKKLIKRIEAELGGLSMKSGFHQRALDGVMVPLPTESQKISFEKESETEWLVLGYLSPPISSPDYPAMKVLDSILGGSMNSRLFTELRDKKGLAYQVGSTYPSRLGPSIFATYIGGSPDHHEKIIEGILEEVQKVKNEPIPADELENAKTYIKGTFIMYQETNMGQASLYGLYEKLGVDADYVEEYPKLVSEVTAEKIQEVARKYLSLYTLASIAPKKE